MLSLSDLSALQNNPLIKVTDKKYENYYCRGCLLKQHQYHANKHQLKKNHVFFKKIPFKLRKMQNLYLKLCDQEIKLNNIDHYLQLSHMAEFFISFMMQTNQYKYSLLKNPKINIYTPLYIIELLTHESLIRLEEFMRRQKFLEITEFLRFFRELIPIDPATQSRENEFFIHYGLFKFFKEICKLKKKTAVTFSQISTFIAEKMPTFTDMFKMEEKMLPVDFTINEDVKNNIHAPTVFGKMIQERGYFLEKTHKSDKIHHLNRTVGQSQYSKKFNIYFTYDAPSPIISILDEDFNLIRTLQTQNEMSKRDSLITTIAWSEKQQKIACILGNYSISLWSKDDEYKYEVNVPLPPENLAHPFIQIKYLESMKRWITLDNRPAIYVLSNSNYEPQYMFLNSKMRKIKETQKIIVLELKYRELVCVAFERNLFLIQLQNKEIVTSITDYKTSITSVAFSESYQALFVSTYEKSFFSYELKESKDLFEMGQFEGHKTQISLLGVLENKPVVFSIQENSILRMFDIRDGTCYQSFSVLKNIVYKQILFLEDAICLVGSKMHVYKLQKRKNTKESQKIVFFGEVEKNILVVTNKNVRIYDIRNGALIQVLKGIFDSESQSNIYTAFCTNSKKKLFILNQQGQCAVFETLQMMKIRTFYFQPKPFLLYFDDENDLVVQCSMGNLSISKYNDEFIEIEERRSITNKHRLVNYLKIYEIHDMIVIGYEGDDSLYFYAYEKGKILGSLNYGKSEFIGSDNPYVQKKQIKRIVGVEFFEKDNIFVILLSDQLHVMTYKRNLSTIVFSCKKKLPLWREDDFPEGLEVKIDPENCIHSAGLCLFGKTAVAISNRANLFATVQIKTETFEFQFVLINRQNYNPYRIGSEEHNEILDLKNPIKIFQEEVSTKFKLEYYHHKQQKMGAHYKSEKIGSLMLITDHNQIVYFFQKGEWDKVAGVIDYEYTLPRSWNLFNYSEKQLEEIDFVLKFLDNEIKIDSSAVFRHPISKKNSSIDGKQAKISKITITQVIEENMKKNPSVKAFRACSLREKKMVLQKERDQKEKMENFLKHRRSQLGKTKVEGKSNAQKQIHETLSYLSLNHNEAILKKGIADNQTKQIRNLERRLNASIGKDEKKSLVSNITGKQSLLSRKMLVKSEKKTDPLLEKQKSKATIAYEELTKKLGLSASSNKLIEKLKLERESSQKKKKQVLKVQSLPKIAKF